MGGHRDDRHSFYSRPVFDERNDEQAANSWLTMVHGFSQNCEYFDRQVAEFASSYRVFTPNLLGHGARDRRAAEYAVSGYALDILEQFDERGVADTHVWGSHTGAAVALWLAVHHPKRIRSLILEAPVVPGRPMPMVAARLDRARATAISDGPLVAMEDWFDNAEFFESIRRDPVRRRAGEHRAMVLRFPGHPLVASPPPDPAPSLVDDLAAIACPVLAYVGADDIDDFRTTATWLTAQLAQAVDVVLPGAGGFPAWEDPDQTNRLVVAFLESVDGLPSSRAPRHPSAKRMETR